MTITIKAILQITRPNYYCKAAVKSLVVAKLQVLNVFQSSRCRTPRFAEFHLLWGLETVTVCTPRCHCERGRLSNTGDPARSQSPAVCEESIPEDERTCSSARYCGRWRGPAAGGNIGEQMDAWPSRSLP